MRLSTRMWLLGAVVPSASLLVGLLVASRVFEAALLSSLDQGLLAQAAAESVSLFDRPDGPHLHMAESPLLEAVRPFAPTGELFDSKGTLVAHFPPLPHPTAKAPSMSEASPALTIADTPLGRVRVLVVRVVSAGGEQFALRLSASMGQLDASVRQFRQVSLALVVITAALLMALQLASARRLAVRLSRLSKHLARVRQGQLDEMPEPDAASDEVAELRAVLAETTVQLKSARVAQERLLAEAAHELRTPLTLMRTSLDLALRRERSVDDLRGALNEARTEVDRLAHLATRLLELGAAARSWDMVLGELRPLLEESTEVARAEAEQRGVWFELGGPAGLVARFSPVALRQAVDNLVSNALRFAPHGTPIVLELSEGVRGSDAQPVVRLSVTDAGPGIPEAQREAVFAPFHRLDQRGGSGLGLAIVSEVMRLHQGRAWAGSPASGRGTVITLEWPRQLVATRPY